MGTVTYEAINASVPGPSGNPMSDGTNMAGGGVRGKIATDFLDHHGGVGGKDADSVMGNNMPGKACIGGDNHGGMC